MEVVPKKVDEETKQDLENNSDESEVMLLKIDLLAAYLESLKAYNYYNRKNKRANLTFLKISALLERFLQFENKKRYDKKTCRIFTENRIVDKKEKNLKRAESYNK
ncbi:hypothetical protein VCUG_00111 [Vavraia culicis subsp. floridensis]|uniref:Uncharacterized protein n=1 Tax=Vavraia culicis (isolate floridensis) TaxID=948595 RepID=L2GYS7_VAVCU|nr:uncharacterized protein VCUG_00111 [Vavraia culicis subsp. floridensis]ELA48502.1 hypothetical protein VCUG_00111 [Vavraia culicis subsp. floridensis]